jgi:hypothetical protein
MKEFGLEPGPLIGALLKLVTEAQDVGTIADQNDALTLLRKKLTPLKKKYKLTKS